MSISPAHFEEHLKVLFKHFEVIPLEKALTLLEKKQPKGEVVITFDDGYLDNYTHAFPLLKKYGCPAMIFITVNPVQQQSRLWYDRIKTSILETKKTEIDLRKFDMPVFSLQNRKVKIKAINTIVKLVKKSRVFDRMPLFLNHIEKETHSTARHNDKDALMTFEQIKEMEGNNISFGSHTLNHPILTRINPDQLADEIQGSKKELESRLGHAVNVFAYPNGEASDFDEKTAEMLKKAGYRAACTLMPGSNGNGEFFHLKRFGIDTDYTSIFPFLTRALFAVEISGLSRLIFLRGTNK